MKQGLNKILISGWFSFDLPHNTAGDLLAKESAITWATKGGFKCDVIVPRPSSTDELTLEDVRPLDYHAIVFVCGPLTSSHIVPFMRKFAGIRRIALNVSVVPTADLSDEFDIIIPRDSPQTTNPDISLASSMQHTPVAGIIYVGKQKEYPGQRHEAVEDMVSSVVKKMGIAPVFIDTKIPHNQYGLSSVAQVEAVIRHMDVIITTRLHGSVLALRNGTPPIAIDSVPGGAKVLRQMQALNWPLAYSIDDLDERRLEKAIRAALTEQSKKLALQRIKDAKTKLESIELTFLKALNS